MFLYMLLTKAKYVFCVRGFFPVENANESFLCPNFSHNATEGTGGSKVILES